MNYLKENQFQQSPLKDQGILFDLNYVYLKFRYLFQYNVCVLLDQDFTRVCLVLSAWLFDILYKEKKSELVTLSILVKTLCHKECCSQMVLTFVSAA